jgi:hypothetical protein
MATFPPASIPDALCARFFYCLCFELVYVQIDEIS